MEKTIDDVKGLAREVFRINNLFGRTTINGKKSIFIWNKGIVPRIIALIVPSNDRVYIERRYEKKASEFKKKYEGAYSVRLTINYYEKEELKKILNS